MSLAAWKILIAVAASAVLISGHFVPRLRRAVTPALLVVALLGAAVYYQFFQFPRLYVHHWDMYHYYMGSRYFDEVGYTGLYDATAVSMMESPDFQARATLLPEHPVRNLATNELGTAQQAYDRGLPIKARFSAERWEMFHLELKFWGPSREFWGDVLQDHGYNASPVSHRLYSLATEAFGERNAHRMLILALVDPLLLLLCGLLIAWAFGLRAMLLAAIVYAVNYGTSFDWIGGTFVRQDWLLFLVAGLCCYKKEKYVLAGAGFAAATLSRLFPALFLAGLFVKIGQDVWRTRTLAPRFRRLIVGGAVASIVLVGASMTTSHGAGIWRDFAGNIGQHASTPAVNNVGVKVAITYRIGHTLTESQKLARRPGADGKTPAQLWRAGRESVYAKYGWVARVAGILFLIGFLIVIKDTDEVTAIILGGGLIPWLLTSASYYFTFAILLVLLVRDDRPTIGAAIPLALCFPFVFVGSSDWTFYYYSVATCALTAAMLAAVRLGHTRSHQVEA